MKRLMTQTKKNASSGQTVEMETLVHFIIQLFPAGLFSFVNTPQMHLTDFVSGD